MTRCASAPASCQLGGGWMRSAGTGSILGYPAHHYHKIALPGSGCSTARQGGAALLLGLLRPIQRDACPGVVRRIRVEVLLAWHLGPPPNSDRNPGHAHRTADSMKAGVIATPPRAPCAPHRWQDSST
jgi:hypothetical protein